MKVRLFHFGLRAVIPHLLSLIDGTAVDKSAAANFDSEANSRPQNVMRVQLVVSNADFEGQDPAPSYEQGGADAVLPSA